MSDRPSQSWATPAIRSQPAEALRTFENGLAVHLIETHREDFISCAADDPLAEVVENSRSRQFDFLPVTEPTAVGVGSARIIGLIHLVPFLAEDAAPEGSVGRYMQPLSEQNLIGADASILEFVRDADRRSLRFVVAGREISGLVSLSDLQRLPTRASLFALVTYLEMTMTEVIRCHIGDADPLERLPPDRRKKVYEKIAKRNDRTHSWMRCCSRSLQTKSLLSKGVCCNLAKTSSRKTQEKFEIFEMVWRTQTTTPLRLTKPDSFARPSDSLIIGSNDLHSARPNPCAGGCDPTYSILALFIIEGSSVKVRCQNAHVVTKTLNRIDYKAVKGLVLERHCGQMERNGRCSKLPPYPIGCSTVE
jgi:hypothetical protein